MIFIRVDGNEMIGLGHVMRCLSIADALRDLGTDVLFVSADNKFESLFRQRGYSSVSLDTDYADMPGEMDTLFRLIDEHHPDMILIDSYYVTDDYLRSLRYKVYTIYLDDQLSFPYPVDVLINYNIFSRRADYDQLYRDALFVPQFVLGTEYTPLRKEFSQVSPNSQPAFAGRVLVSTGGADSQHIALQLIRSIRDNAERFEDYAFTFIIGSANADKNEICEIAESIENINIVCNAQNMSALMLSNEIAVSAAGSTLYELCACGLPTITYVLADNQIPAAELFGEKGIMINAGDVRKDPEFIDRIFEEISRLATDKELREQMSHSAHQIADGRGAFRLAKMITQLQEDNNVSI